MALGLATFIVAQDPAKDIKKAARLLGTYNLDQTGSLDKLQEAIDLANASIDDPTVKNDPAAWQTYGEIFMAAVDNDVKDNVFAVTLLEGRKFESGPEGGCYYNNDSANKVYVDRAFCEGKLPAPKQPSAPAKAFKGFEMAAALADKSYQIKDAMKALSSGIQNIYYLGSALYQAGDYASAYEAFKATYDGYSLLLKNEEPTTFSADEHPKALYYSALCAQQAGKMNEAKLVFEQMVDESTRASTMKEKLIVGPQGGCYYNNDSGNKVYVDRAYCEGKMPSDMVSVYETLFSIYIKEDSSKAEKILALGREKFPDDTGLLYAEINYLLAKGELVGLISKLEKAIEIEPENISVYVTLGQIFDKLYQDQATTDPLTAEENFNKAMSYYQQALAKDPKSFDAVYSIGALWYNKAAGYSIELNNLSSDYSAAGNRKYEAIKAKMDETFVKALPFFLQAEEINPKDANTLIALKEIYARQDKLDLVETYKQKLEMLEKQ